MTLITIDEDDSRPLYRQIAAGVRRAVIDGALASGDRLPPGRDLAQALGVNLETVQRAYRLLADEGVVVSRVGRGTRVSDHLQPADVALTSLVESLVAEAQRLGVPRDTLLDRVRAAYER